MNIKNFIKFLESIYKNFRYNIEIVFVDEEGNRYKINDVDCIKYCDNGKSEYIITGKKYKKRKYMFV